jgi:dihydroxyacid dehydratase/phosphogluconate dehydratase
VDALPNGPHNHPTVQVFMAGGVPEVMLHLRRLGVLDLAVRTVSGLTLDEQLDWWEQSERRRDARARLAGHGGDPDHVSLAPHDARRAGMTGTMVFPVGNVAPLGSVVKATAIDPAVVGDDGVYRHEGPARVFTSEADAVAAIKGVSEPAVQAGDVVVIAGSGPTGTGMEETYQVTSALKFVPFGRTVAVVTDGRFSGVSTGPCVGHVSPEALAGGPIGRLRDGDRVRVQIDRANLTASVDLVGTADGLLSPEAASELLASRPPHPGLAPAEALPADTRLWAALQEASGGTWAGCTYDVDRIVALLEAGRAAVEGR